MRAGIFLLGLAYVLSQFFRAFLAVLTPLLERDLGTTPDDLANASSLWFICFAAMQIPIGAALDSIGPRRTAAWLLLIGGAGGAALFAVATTGAHINIAMALIGVGCAPVLMASYYIFAREFPPARFAFLASLMVGLGSLGNLGASYPMGWAAEVFGWRSAIWGLAGLSAVVAFGILVTVKDPPKVEAEAKGSLIELLRLRALWPIFPLMGVSYGMAAGVRSLWISPYLEDVFNADLATIGIATLLMSIAMIIGALAFGWLDRFFTSRKTMIASGTAFGFAAGLALIVLPPTSVPLAVALFCAIGFFGATYSVIMAHGRAFLPPHLIGRGVTLLNLFSIGGAGVLQFLSGRVYSATLGTGGITTPYIAVFTLFTAFIAVGFVIYLFSKDAPG
jgi:MFS family permease